MMDLFKREWVRNAARAEHSEKRPLRTPRRKDLLISVLALLVAAGFAAIFSVWITVLTLG